jgi:hypothetical protein
MRYEGRGLAPPVTHLLRSTPEQQLLAYVYGKFKESDLLGIKTEAEKMLMLAALNLVECIAETAPRKTQ